MKIFANIEELWNYCLFCPVCQKDCREMIVSVGPDILFRLNSFQKENSILELSCRYIDTNYYFDFNFKINCLENSFDIDAKDLATFPMQIADNSYERFKNTYFFFIIQSTCRKCKHTSAYSSDIEFDFSNKKISKIEFERESFYLLKEPEKYYISINYDESATFVSKCFVEKENNYNVITLSGKNIKLPLIKLDLVNQASCVQKIKTLVLFS